MEDSRNKYIEELEEVIDGLEDEVHQADYSTPDDDNDVGNVTRHTRHAAMSAAMSRSTRPW